MHLRANTVQAEKVKAVYLDNKLIKMPFELDTEEGWVDHYVPKLFGGVQYVAGEETVCNSNVEAPKFDYELVRSKGHIVVVFRSDEDDQ